MIAVTSQFYLIHLTSARNTYHVTLLKAQDFCSIDSIELQSTGIGDEAHVLVIDNALQRITSMYWQLVYVLLISHM